MKQQFTLRKNAVTTGIFLLLACIFLPFSGWSQWTFATNSGSSITITSSLGGVCEAPEGKSFALLAGSPILATQDQLNQTFNGISTSKYFKARAGQALTLSFQVQQNNAAATAQAYFNQSANASVGTLTAVPLTWQAGGNFTTTATVNFPQGSYKSYLSINLQEVGNGGGPEPKGTQIVIPFVVEGAINPTCTVLGTTVQPQMPYLVLHAPPGDGSSSEFQTNKTTCREFTDTYAEDGSNTGNLAVKLGVSGQLGLIVTVDYELSVTFSGSATVGDMSVKTTSTQNCVSVNEGFSTSEISGPDGGGDVFIGYGTDLNYGVYDFVEINAATCSPETKTGLIYAPTGQPRKFAYTKSAILSDIEQLQSKVDNPALSTKVRNDAQNQIEVWNQVLALNETNVNSTSNAPLGTISFSAGANSTYESGITIVETNSIEVEHYIEGTVGMEGVVEVAGSGVTGGYEYKSSKRYGKSTNQSVETSKVVGFSLADDDSGDVFNVEVVSDPMFGTPIFRTQSGTKSSCPYQGGYQRDQPKLQHDGTSDAHITSLGNAVGTTATFKLDLCNESNEARSYNLKLNAQSNLNGVVVSAAGVPLNGNDLGQSFTVPANTCVQDLVIEVKMQSSSSPLAYPDLELFLYAACEEEIQSSVFASVFFGNATAVEDFGKNIAQLAVYPNPATDVVNLAFDLLEAAPVQVSVYDMLGRLQIQLPKENLWAGSHQKQLEVRQLPDGIYFVNIASENQHIMRKLRVGR